MPFGKQLSRREILKIISLSPLAAAVKWIDDALSGTAENLPNILVFVFDAWSGRHLSMHGYPRRTMPNLEKYAEKATVYHRHYSAATFTVPGTASLLTGLHPWSHRAIALASGAVLERHRTHQAFASFSSSHSTLGYAQNELADLFLYQFAEDLDVHIKSGAFQLEHHGLNDTLLFPKDPDASFASFYNNIFFQQNRGFDSSLLIGPAVRLWRIRERALNNLANKDEYPHGLPLTTDQFLLSDLVDGVLSILGNINRPTFAYLHLFPPHAPYGFSRQFKKSFHDGWLPPEKPIHELSSKRAFGILNAENEYYDEYLANWDAELGRFFEYLHSSGLFDNSYIVFTSDHGEMFERGESGHFTPLIYDPLIHVPLIISRPGQSERQDIHTPTSSVDLLPTLANLAGTPVPEWTEGRLLPMLGGVEDAGRSVFSIDAKSNSVFAPLTRFTLSMTRGDFRLTYYKYPTFTKFEFYNLREDPEELNDFYPDQPALSLQMKDELLQKLSEVNKPFER